MKIPFNKPGIAGNELAYIKQAVDSGKLSGNGVFSNRCREYTKQKFGFENTLLTNSCTAALEMIATLIEIQPGDEVIVPSFTFVSTANAFASRGAKIVFADSTDRHPNIEVSSIESLITAKTKAIVIMHYGGVAVDMNSVLKIASGHSKKIGHRIFVIEDAAHSIGAKYEDKYLGTIGDFGTISFHETKNIQCGEGGMLLINDPAFMKRAEVIWEKGTNRVSFSRGEIKKYDWIDTGSSYLLSELSAAYLYAQLECFDLLHEHRKELYAAYGEGLKSDNKNNNYATPEIAQTSSHNYHIYYLLCGNKSERDDLIAHLASQDIMAVFHYQSLHRSKYGSHFHDGRELSNSDRFSDCLVRLPLYPELQTSQISEITRSVRSFYSRFTP